MVKAGNIIYRHIGDLPDTVPVFPLTGALLLPGGSLPLNIFEPRYLDMIDSAMRGTKIIGMVQPCLKSPGEEASTTPLCNIGCLGRVSALQETGDGRYSICLSGVCRYEIMEELDVGTKYRQCRVRIFKKDLIETRCSNEEIDREALLVAFKNFLCAHDMEADWTTIEKTESETLVTALCMMCPYDPAEKQALLEAPDSKSRAETLIAISEMHLARQSCPDGKGIQ